MTTRIALTHTLEQRFERRILLPTHWLRLRPAPHTRSPITAYSLKIDTDPHFLNWVRDPFENYLARLDFPEPVASLHLTLDLIADLAPVNPFDFLVESAFANYPFEYPEQLLKELTPYLYLPKPGPFLADWLGALEAEKGYIIGTLGKLTGDVHSALKMVGEARLGAVDLDAVLAKGEGSPWEAAWLLTLSLRKLGLAARFTSGYRVFMAPEPVTIGDAAPQFLDSVGLHAWSEVFLPGAGWVGLDPAAGLFINEGYIPLASTPDPLRALPWVAETSELTIPALALSGTPQVRRLIPEAAPAPYTAAQWADIAAVGQQVDEQLGAVSIDLAMAPTVCFTAPYSTAMEWSTAALGPAKRAAADELLTRLGRQLGPGGVVHAGQGEWFGGENLPRWKLSYFYRADGHPLWRNPPLVGTSALNSGLTATDAEYFAQTLAKKLGVSPQHLMPAYEDQLYELWQNRAHLDFDPPAEALRNPVQRRALATKLSQTRREPVGYVLPLRWDSVAGLWVSGTWQFRRGALYLVPGDSPLGYRLPLESLPVGEDATATPDPERCPFEERPLLPEVHGELGARLTTYIATPPPAQQADDPDHAIQRAPRTALAVEIRQGRLAIFMPPLTHLEYWLDLITAIEATALSLGLPVLLEGYEPPEDFRLRRLLIEPESGVLRVVLPMAESWTRVRDALTHAYREAADLGLLAERIAADGRRQPPGGNAEIVLGGEQPASSPFLLKPQLLHSLIAYWQQHPSLSYFFAGRMVGPSGPAPRPDEGRDDALYELDIALSRMPLDDDQFPWIPDRVLRHLLADPAGEMKRAEIRVDQLYGPDRASQRLGRIAIRAFETAATAPLAVAQNLLLRALIAYLARHPADPRLEDFGPALRDRFLLPRILWEDLREVLRDIERAGVSLQAEWFAPFLEQRFPLLGQMQFDDVGLELRMAHEPWPVLSEEVVAGGVTRFVDSSTQRVQVEITGFIPSRHVLICNGQRVPLQTTRRRGQVVAGVRYKVWNPPSTLHPTLPPVYSLVFDLVDARTGAVLGGCTYLPARPDLAGAVATPRPASDTDSEGLGEPQTRRPQPVNQPPWSPGGRFLNFGSGARRVSVPDEKRHPRFPYLLDLLPLG